MRECIQATPGPRPAIFLSASVPTGQKDYPDNLRHYQSARPQWIRDAVLAVARGTLRRDWCLVFGAHPSISPMILTVAREFREPAQPRVAVFQSEFFLGRFPQETLELADGRRGRLVVTPKQADLAASLAHMRKEMFTRPGLVAAVFVGGMDGIVDEAKLFKQENSQLPTYALASAGGAAADLLDRTPSPYAAEHFCGGPLAPVPMSVLTQERVGYVRAARAALDAIASALANSPLRPRP